MKTRFFFQLPIYLCLVLVFYVSCNKSSLSNNFTEIRAEGQAHDTFKINTKALVIPLEAKEQSILADLQKIVFFNNEFFVSDQFKREIKCFDIQGKYKRKLSKLGKGPGEYIAITDYYVTNDLIYLLTNTGNINIYKANNFEFINQISIPSSEAFSDIFVDNQYIYMVSILPTKKSKKIVQVFTYKNFKLKKHDELIDFTVSNKSKKGFYVNAHIKNFQLVSNSSENVLFNQSFDNLIYEFRNGSINGIISLNFGKFSIPQEKLNISFETIENFQKNKNARCITNYLKSNTHHIFKLQEGFYKSIYLTYNNNTKICKYYKNLFLSPLNCEVELFGSCPLGFIGVIEPDLIFNQLELLNKKKLEKKTLSKTDQQFLNVFTTNSNPALVIFTINEN